MGVLHYFRWAFFFTIFGLLLGTWLGWFYTNSFAGVGNFFFICMVLAILEISLSIDNSIVNARVLRHMEPVWQRRFLTWGIIIAVFGMRIIFPLTVIAFSARIDPFSALRLAIWQPHEYARIMMDAHVGISAFGATFLMMVGLKYFFDREKDVHWIHTIETLVHKFTFMQGIEVVLTLVLILIFAGLVGDSSKQTFLIAALYGLLIFLVVEGIGGLLDARQEQMDAIRYSGAGAFIYLEILDSSFSFDGVVGAFALSSNLFIIAIGLGIGAFYVRFITVMLVENQILSRYRYLEHGAFYTILILAFSMYMQTLAHVPEVIIGLISILFILAAFYSSINYNRKHPEKYMDTLEDK
ncbi:MAG: hypothetical protein JSC189_000413 [Candidatus Tokpelaia sp. JSC189]|nr:MAG: hypothetical protein JSC189_000413 [Candidatus Tokpelaia sp. JSC189]